MVNISNYVPFEQCMKPTDSGYEEKQDIFNVRYCIELPICLQTQWINCVSHH